MPKHLASRLTGGGKGPWILVSSVLVAMLVTPFAIAAGEGRPLLGGARNPSSNQSLDLTRETEIIAETNTYGTRQSNKSDNGGGAIYGCRSKPGGTPQSNEPCIRANNLDKGRAFEFVSGGDEVGRIESPNAGAAPFTTNAQGVAGGLNADRVDSKNAEDIVKDAQNLNKFAAVAANGSREAGRGSTAAARAAEGVYTVDFDTNVSACARTATLVGTSAGTVATELVDGDTVRVHAFALAGPAPTPADQAFHLLVIC